MVLYAALAQKVKMTIEQQNKHFVYRSIHESTSMLVKCLYCEINNIYKNLINVSIMH